MAPIDLGECLVPADALRTDVDPRTSSHLAVHHPALAIEPRGIGRASPNAALGSSSDRHAWCGRVRAKDIRLDDEAHSIDQSIVAQSITGALMVGMEDRAQPYRPPPR